MSLPILEPPIVVLDTNVVLDWLIFRNPDCAKLQASLGAGDLRWLATAAMRDELTHVLARGRLDAWSPDLRGLWAHWDRHCDEVPAAPPAAVARLRCTDPDDQKFIDLAVACRARWLFSHDRAVHKLARRLSEMGVEVCTPGAWAGAGAAA